MSFTGTCTVFRAQDIKQGFKVLVTVASTSDEDCYEQCNNKTGCTAWVRKPSVASVF